MSSPVSLRCLIPLLALVSPALAFASGEASAPALDLTSHPLGLLAVGLFVLAYALVVAEERLHLRKSKPVMLAAAAIWTIVAVYCATTPGLAPDLAANAFRHIFL